MMRDIEAMYDENLHDWLDEREIERDEPTTLEALVSDTGAAFDAAAFCPPTTPLSAEEVPF